MLVQKFRELFGDKEKKGKINTVMKTIGTGLEILLVLGALGLNMPWLNKGIGKLIISGLNIIDVSQGILSKKAYAQTPKQENPKQENLVCSVPEKENSEKENLDFENPEKRKMHLIYNVPKKLSIHNREDFDYWVNRLVREQFDDKKMAFVFTKQEFEEFINKHKPSHIKEDLKLKDDFTLLVFSDKVGSLNGSDTIPVNIVIVNDAKKSVFTADELAKEISDGIDKNSDALLPYMENEKNISKQLIDALFPWKNANGTSRETSIQIGNSVDVIEGTKKSLGSLRR